MLFTNTYPKAQATFFEGIMKNIRYHYLKRKNFKVNKKDINVLFYPDYPKTGSTVARTLRAMNINITNNPKEGYDTVFFWLDTTEIDNPGKILAPLNLKSKAFNQNCTDISKSTVDRIFEDVFNYSIKIDPTKFEGTCLEKCDENALGVMDEIVCPISTPKAGYVYQKIIDNSVNSDYIADMRVIIFGGDIPFIIDKWIPRAKRYKKKGKTNLDYKYHRKNTNDLLSKEEQSNIIKLAKIMGLDCGEMDILRDKTDGKIYIIDVNKTPTMLISRFNDEEQNQVYKDLKYYFKKNYLD